MDEKNNNDIMTFKPIMVVLYALLLVGCFIGLLHSMVDPANGDNGETKISNYKEISIFTLTFPVWN